MDSTTLTHGSAGAAIAHRSYQQQWAEHLLATGCGSCAQVVLELTGSLDEGGLRAACDAVVARHEILQGASRDVWIVCDLTLVAPEARARSVERVAETLCERTVPSPLRFALLRSSAARHDLVLTCSPVVADAATLRQCSQELLDAYHGVHPPGDPLPYADVAAWQEGLLHEDEGQAGRRYWAKQDSGAFETEQLPFERDALPVTTRSVSRSVRLDATGSESLSKRTPAFWLACWHVLLHRLSNGARFGIGVVADARRYDELKDVVGPLDRVLPVRPPVRGDERLARSVAAVEQLLQDHAAWQEYYVAPAAAQPSWRAGFAHVEWPDASQRGELRARPVSASVESTGAPLALVVHQHGDAGPCIRLHYDRRAFLPADVRTIGRRLLTLASDAAARPGAAVDALSLLTAAERDEAVTRWNATDREWSGSWPMSLLEALERQASSTPDAIAVQADEGTWTYTSLHAQANQIARRLQRLGVGAESRVGVWVPRSATLVAALVGVMKAGAAYVPLDPAYPPARLAFQITDAQVAVVLTTSECRAAVPPGPYAIEVLDGPDAAWRQEPSISPEVSVWPDQLAYVIYTSGSTGQPKGAMNTHRGIGNRLAWMQAAYALGPSDRVLQKTSCSFDVSVWEFFWPLATGATLVLARPGGQNDPSYVAATIARAQVTVLHFVPAMLEAFVAAGGLKACGSVRLIVSSGEALPGALAARCRVAWPGRLENLYGPTEAAVDVTSHPCTDATAADRAVPIGRPIANTQAYVLDRSGHPASVGVIGELYLGGVQVGRGYWGRPDLTAERFVPDAFGRPPGARLYRTGDLAQYRADGVIEYVGRADQQVKLHGNRIELGEVEAALQQQPEVRHAAVLLREDEPGVRRLVAYVVAASSDASVRTDALQRQLRARLPEYMVPAVIVTLASLPVTANGKVDRRALPAPSGERPSLAAPYVAPRSEVETTLARIWAEVLQVDRVGVDDNFFALGGDSILSLQVVARAMQAGWRLAPRLVFEHPTVAALARVVHVAAEPRADQAPLVGPVPLLPIQQWFFGHELPAPHHFNQAVRIELAAASAAVVDTAWLALQRHHDALRFRYTRTADGWTQTATGLETAAQVSTIDLRAVAADHLVRVEQRIATAVQTSLDLTRGPVARAVVLLADGRNPHALLVIHHLVIDGVSWRTLLADFELASRQLQDGQAVALPPKTTSVREWAEGLRVAGSTEALAAELPFWRDASAPTASLPREREAGANTIRASRTEEVVLSPEDTRALLHDLPARGAAHVIEVVLASLVQTLAGWTGDSAWRIDLEGHGREALGDLDVSRTVGWFTSLYPVRLVAADTAVETLRTVKATLRGVPQSGLGYGILRYFGGSAAAPLGNARPADILVNYLGQVDQALAPAAAALRPSDGPIGPMRDPDAPREYVLEVNAIVVGGQLRVSWTFSAQFEPGTIRALADRFIDLIPRLIGEALAGRADDEMGPSAFTHAALDDDELRRIARLLDMGDLE